MMAYNNAVAEREDVRLLLTTPRAENVTDVVTDPLSMLIDRTDRY